MKKVGLWTICCLLMGWLCACSTTKYVPDGEYLLDEVALTSDNADIKASRFANYVRQNPNSRWMSSAKVPLAIYSLSGRDSTKWVNRMWRRLGQEPVIFSLDEANKSAEAIRQAVQTYGYLGTQVDLNTKVHGKKLGLTYHIHPRNMYKIQSLQWDIADTRVDSILRADSLETLLQPGMDFNANTLSSERSRITNKLLNMGFYQFNKEFLTFEADTCQGTYLVDVTMHIRNQYGASLHNQYHINKVQIMASPQPTDSIDYHGVDIFYKNKLRMRPRVLTQASDLKAGDLFSQSNLQKSYDNYNRLQALRYTNIRLLQDPADSLGLVAQVLTDFNKSQSVAAELEGTNSAGDLGAAASLTYSHRNLFRGSENFSFKLRGAYEAITGLEGYSNENYVEIGAEASLKFPRFLMPFVSHDFMREKKASSEVSIQYNLQNRPEFRRRVASAVWRYRWTSRNKKMTHRFDVLDLNYVYMPWISATFKEQYLDNLDNYNAILRYNYEDLFITKLGYSFTYNSQGIMGVTGSNMGTNSYTIRANVESSGNVLYAFDNLINVSSMKIL